MILLIQTWISFLLQHLQNLNSQFIELDQKTHYLLRDVVLLDEFLLHLVVLFSQLFAFIFHLFYYACQLESFIYERFQHVFLLYCPSIKLFEYWLGEFLKVFVGWGCHVFDCAVENYSEHVFHLIFEVVAQVDSVVCFYFSQGCQELLNEKYSWKLLSFFLCGFLSGHSDDLFAHSSVNFAATNFDDHLDLIHEIGSSHVFSEFRDVPD